MARVGEEDKRSDTVMTLKMRNKRKEFKIHFSGEERSGVLSVYTRCLLPTSGYKLTKYGIKGGSPRIFPFLPQL